MPSFSFTGIKAIVKALLEAPGLQVDVQDCQGRTPFIEACKKGSQAIVQLLINHKVDVNETDCNGDSPLHVACANGLLIKMVELSRYERAEGSLVVKQRIIVELTFLS